MRRIELAEVECTYQSPKKIQWRVRGVTVRTSPATQCYTCLHCLRNDCEHATAIEQFDKAGLI